MPYALQTLKKNFSWLLDIWQGPQPFDVEKCNMLFASTVPSAQVDDAERTYADFV